MKILVLGSEGQIGKPTCEYLEERGHTVIRMDKKISPTHDLADIRVAVDLPTIMDGCDFVYFFAANVGGAKYLEKYQDTFGFIDENMRIMSNVFRALKNSKKPFLFTSSQMSELGHSTYGQLKSVGEKITRDLGGLLVRLWNVYGVEHEEEKAHVITDFCRMAREGHIKMRTDGTESRQLLYVEDCAECFLTLTEQYDNLDKSKNYHITNFEWNTILDVANILKDISGCEINPSNKKDQTQKNAMNEPDPYILNYWKPKTTLREGIEKIYVHTVQNN